HQLLPEKAVVEIGGAGIGIEDLLGLRARRRVLAGLADEHPVDPPCGKTVGENGACRTATDDDVVEVHRFPHEALFSCAQDVSGSALLQSSMDTGRLYRTVTIGCVQGLNLTSCRRMMPS